MLNLLLLADGGWAALLVSISIVMLGIGALITFLLKRSFDNKKLDSAKNEAERIKNEALTEAKTLRKEALLEAKEEQHRLRAEVEKESKERKNELNKTEQRLIAKEQAADKRDEILDRRSEQLDNFKKALDTRESDLKAKQSEVDSSYDKMLAELQRVAGLSAEEAKKQLLDELLDDVKRDAGAMAKQIEQTAKDEAEMRAKHIVALAIQRCATDHAAEITISSVGLPGDEMKGRLIGREGRNIRAIESATGVDLIIDDTPDVVTLSSFDPVRREIARITLEKLIADGRIHPARIEEFADKARKEVEQLVKEAGENAIMEAEVYNVHPEMVKLLGRLKYRTSYGQNVLAHSLEVSHLAGMMAAELGGNVKLARRGGLFHDIGKSVDHEYDGTHVSIGVEIAQRCKESAEVIHCIAAHHNDEEPQTLEAILVQAADGISGGRPGARRESLENYIKRLEKLEAVANSFKGVESSFAIQAGREIRVMVKPEKVNDDSMIILAHEIAAKLEDELDYPGQIKVNLIRETRVVDYAK